MADIGPEFSRHVRAEIQFVLDDANRAVRKHLRRRDRARTAAEAAQHLAAAERLLDPHFIVRKISVELVRGWPDADIEWWIERRRFDVQPSFSSPGFKNSIYGRTGHVRPWLLIAVRPTVNMFGVEFGLDKISHFFQQGYEYYEAYTAELMRTGDERSASRHVVGLGISQEMKGFGLTRTGIYSNADLAANYAGLKFYLNLTRTVRIGRATLPPILSVVNGKWCFRGGPTRELFRPLVSLHFNEAFNPCHYADDIVDIVGAAVAAREATWRGRYKLAGPAVAVLRRELMTWHGEHYGHWQAGRSFSLTTHREGAKR